MEIIAFFAHPDDETMLIGGTLALLAESGASVHYLCATRGEGGEVGEPPVCTQEELGEVREQELVCAVGALGGSSLTFLGYEDPRIGPDEELYGFTDNLTFLAGQVATSIKQNEAVAVITHGSNGEYGHPGHVLCYQAALAAVLSYYEGGTELALYSVAADFPDHPRPRLANKDDPAHLLVDVNPALDRKEKAAYCHKTQNALFVRRASQDEGRPVTIPEVLMQVESLHRAHPVAEGELDDLVANLLRSKGLLLDKK